MYFASITSTCMIKECNINQTDTLIKLRECKKLSQQVSVPWLARSWSLGCLCSWLWTHQRVRLCSPPSAWPKLFCCLPSAFQSPLCLQKGIEISIKKIQKNNEMPTVDFKNWFSQKGLNRNFDFALVDTNYHFLTIVMRGVCLEVHNRHYLHTRRNRKFRVFVFKFKYLKLKKLIFCRIRVGNPIFSGNSMQSNSVNPYKP